MLQRTRGRMEVPGAGAPNGRQSDCRRFPSCGRNRFMRVRQVWASAARRRGRRESRSRRIAQASAAKLWHSQGTLDRRAPRSALARRARCGGRGAFLRRLDSSGARIEGAPDDRVVPDTRARTFFRRGPQSSRRAEGPDPGGTQSMTTRKGLDRTPPGLNVSIGTEPALCWPRSRRFVLARRSLMARASRSEAKARESGRQRACRTSFATYFAQSSPRRLRRPYV
jgi:hypothetical protein